MSQPYHFRLYVAGDAPNSAQALANLRAVCCELLPERHRIEIVDVLRDPKRALEDGVLLTPTLVQLAPAPGRIVGNLNERHVLVQTLGLEDLQSNPPRAI